MITFFKLLIREVIAGLSRIVAVAKDVRRLSFYLVLFVPDRSLSTHLPFAWTLHCPGLLVGPCSGLFLLFWVHPGAPMLPTDGSRLLFRLTPIVLARSLSTHLPFSASPALSLTGVFLLFPVCS